MSRIVGAAVVVVVVKLHGSDHGLLKHKSCNLRWIAALNSVSVSLGLGLGVVAVAAAAAAGEVAAAV